MTDYQFKHHFSLDEANASIPEVAAVFDRVHTLRSALETQKETLASIHKASGGNGGHGQGAELVGPSEMVGQLLGGLEEKGILVKDIDLGLVDFPHLRAGREVFLCWRLGEKRIRFWHELDSGYRGRKPL